MKRKLLQNLSVNALQLIINQLFALVIFYILSISLSKDSFGQINLALAILLAVFNILSFGIDQVIIKKIAAGDDAQSVLSLYISHVLITGLLFYGLLLTGFALFPHQSVYNLLLLIGIGKLMIYFSTPFKQAANGLELFKLVAYLSVISNFVRCICLVVAALLHALNLPVIVAIFIIGDTLELVIGVYLFKRMAKIPLINKWNKANYINLVRESLPQMGVALITSALARFDWIFIGFILSAVKLAEYSFAYKVFEVSTLPLLAIAPLLIPHFTKLFKQQNIHIPNFKTLIRIEMVVAGFIGLVLNMCWAPVIDGLTAGKYGAINVNTIFILSLCMPFLYLNNFLWTMYFAQGRLKMILTAFIITLIVNVAGDIILIPFYKNEGAAFAFLIACTAQAIYFLKKNEIAGLNTIWHPLVICVTCAVCSGLITKILLLNTWVAVPVAVAIYLVLLLATTQVKLTDRKNLGRLLNW
ncbi:oligosaccharide flippase family protein [Mucilaginibacter sp.]|uniref:oligosaccharide flippase family protein n=1 Tax=Mucilaginibacter sp. TaxID=1882438 RepID=UPI0026325028|nr:oligosaccharide flippase family protein [Mucilaginibacter sp.]MDB4925818.1 polysaccharide biosynthesis protein [Mucilaginibacter sp.]